MKIAINKKTVAIFMLAFTVTLVAGMPAALMDNWVRKASGGVVGLANPEGTIWRGAATPVLNLGRNTPLALNRMHWEISFSKVLTGNLLVRLREGEDIRQSPMEILLGFRQAELRNASIELPAAVMGGLNPILLAMHFQGRVAIATDKLVLGRDGTVQGVLTANWRDAGSAMSPLNPFGDYRFDLAGSGKQVKVNLTTVSGVLQLNGDGAWSDGKLGFQVTATAKGDSKAVFSEMLHHLGPETSPGVFLFKIGS